MNGQVRVVIENIQPQVDGGAFPVKRILNDKLVVAADIFCDSHDMIHAELRFKHKDEKGWKTVYMKHTVNDLWKGEFILKKLGIYSYTVRAWTDPFKSWYRDMLKKIEASADYHIDIMIGADIIRKVLERNQNISGPDKTFLHKIIQLFSQKDIKPEKKVETTGFNLLYDVMVKYPVEQHASVCEKVFEVQVDREKANFSTWYEVFPRSLHPDGSKHGSFKDCENFLPYVADMGFDVLYLPPIHPIGFTNRKGKNNSIKCRSGDPGSPWAIGAKAGGHKAIHPELGNLDDFKSLIKKAAHHGMEIAMDIAFQCSPDHPYVKEHPEWFRIRPDGSLQYAENPPKRYEDIYPINFETDDWQALWEELKSIFFYWIDKGVKIFRVDNPHTKSLRFWGWLIDEIKRSHPDVIFLAEAFTRPKVMYNLAKQGFTQSYTYYAWRNTKYDIIQYCKELVNTGVREYFRPNFWPNTPDILPEFLQMTNRAGFIQRLLLAATLSSNYGIYGPAFELMYNKPMHPGSEEYLDSEKYEIKKWNLESSQSLRKIISRINKIRKENKALQNTRSLRFHDIDNDALLCFSKRSDDFSSIILVVVNLDPYSIQSGRLKFPIFEFDMDPHIPYQVHDLLSDSYYLWTGEQNYVEVNPGIIPGHIFKIRRKIRSEHDFDYFM